MHVLERQAFNNVGDHRDTTAARACQIEMDPREETKCQIEMDPREETKCQRRRRARARVCVCVCVSKFDVIANGADLSTAMLSSTGVSSAMYLGRQSSGASDSAAVWASNRI